MIDSKRMATLYAGICALLIAVFWHTTAWAQQVTSDAPAHAHAEATVDEDVKVWALKRGYEINGRSMGGLGSIDLTGEVKGITDPTEFNVLDATVVPPAPSPAASDTCKHPRRCRK